jgi:hypothetical protein
MAVRLTGLRVFRWAATGAGGGAIGGAIFGILIRSRSPCCGNSGTDWRNILKPTAEKYRQWLRGTHFETDSLWPPPEQRKVTSRCETLRHKPMSEGFFCLRYHRYVITERYSSEGVSCRLQWRLSPIVQSAIHSWREMLETMMQRHPGAMIALSSCKWHEHCFLYGLMEHGNEKERLMNLAIWIPATLLMGLAGLGLMCAFIIGCDRV